MKPFRIGVFLFLSVNLHQVIAIAQAANHADTTTQHYQPTTTIKGALLGAIIHPGMKIGIERPFKYKEVTKTGIRSSRSYYKERYFNYSIASYYQTNYHTNLFAQAEIVHRRQKKGGWFYDISLGTGLSRTFVSGASFEVSDQGEVSQSKLSGNWYLLVSHGMSLGYNAKMRHNLPLAFYLKSQILYLLPYNEVLLPRPMIELGINYSLGNFWQANPTYSSKQRFTRKYKKQQKTAK